MPQPGSAKRHPVLFDISTPCLHRNHCTDMTPPINHRCFDRSRVVKCTVSYCTANRQRFHSTLNSTASCAARISSSRLNASSHPSSNKSAFSIGCATDAATLGLFLLRSSARHTSTTRGAKLEGDGSSQRPDQPPLISSPRCIRPSKQRSLWCSVRLRE